MNAAVQVATDGWQIWLSIALLGLPFSLAFEVTLLQRAGLQVLSLVGATQ